MSAEVWFIISIIGFALSALALIGAIILFLNFQIPSVIGDLTGKKVAKGVKAMRSSESASGYSAKASVKPAPDQVKQPLYDPAQAHGSKRLDTSSRKLSGAKTGKTTEPPSQYVPEPDAVITETFSGKETVVLNEDPNATVVLQEETTLLNSDPNATVVLQEETALLNSDPNATAILAENRIVPEPTPFNSAPDATTLLREDAEGTTLLEENDRTLYRDESIGISNTASRSFSVIRSVMDIHTDEVIGIENRR